MSCVLRLNIIKIFIFIWRGQVLRVNKDNKDVVSSSQACFLLAFSLPLFSFKREMKKEERRNTNGGAFPGGRQLGALSLFVFLAVGSCGAASCC